MLISIDWIKEFVDLPEISPKELGQKFTLATAEVEDVLVTGDLFEKLIIAEIKEIERHPDADKLNLVTFDFGAGETKRVVCGAPNVKVGLKVPYAPLGTSFPGGFTLEPKKIRGIKIKTQPYPGFPTDLQAQIMVLMTKAEDVSMIRENIFENRFMHVSELRRMGAHIEVDGNRAKIYGGNHLYGAELMATDLRASVSLVLAGLAAKEKTVINRIYHLDRGYEQIEKKLSACGAFIRRLK